MQLTDEQRTAVEWRDGPLMVLAGAGTGKTTVVVERVRHLLSREPDLQPENVLVLTYNVKAAAELVERLEHMLGLETASRLWVHNFHSFGHRILSDHRADLGLETNADVLDQVGQRLLLRQLRPRFSHFLYHPMARDAGAAGRFADVIGRAKDELVTPEEYMAFAQARREAFDFEHGVGAYDEVVESLRKREAEGTIWQVRAVRSELARNGHEAAQKIASREARREVVGTGEAVWWNRLSREQERLARGLMPTYLRDAAAYEVLRLLEEAEAYAVYQGALRERGLLDFGEQQLRTIQLLIDRPNILQRYQAQFRHVLVDEFQDANMAQIQLLELIGRGPDKPDNVVVVGDDDQSIYRFRGASYAAFERFRERFEQPPAWDPERPVGRVGRQPLLQNRRSTGHILAASGRLIANNSRRLKTGGLRPTKADGRPVEVVFAADEADEADHIVSWIERVFEELPQPRRWSEIAVLYRKHRHRELIVERLRKQGIPHVVVGGTGLFSVPEVRDVEAALRVASNPDDSVAFVRLLSAGPWRMDAAETLRVTRTADWDSRPVFQAAADILRLGEITVPVTAPETAVEASTADMPAPPTLWADEELGAAADQPQSVRERHNREQRTKWRREQLDARLRVKLEKLVGVLNALVPRARRDGPFAVLEDYLVRTNLLHDLIAAETPEAQRSVLALARFMRFVADWQQAHPRDCLADFIGYLDLYQQVGGDLDTDLPGRVEVEGVQLMTVFQAKGLEYEAVVVPRLAEGQFPDLREEASLIPLELLKQEPPSDFAIDEERRLLFVAMTRAKSRLLLSAVAGAGTASGPSRFAGEVAALTGADEQTATPPDVVVQRREPGPQAEIEPDAEAAASLTGASTGQLLKLMPVPQAHERRFALRRRAVEIIGLLESVAAEDHAGRAALTAELVSVAEEAAGIADEARRNGLDPLTLTVLARHAPAGETLLEQAPLPNSFSHSQLQAYAECPLRYALQRVYRIPVPETPGYFEFGGTIHQAFEGYARARREAVAAGLPPPGYEALRQQFDAVWKPRNYADAQSAEHYQKRAEPALRRFYDREVASLAEAVAFEIGFTLEIEDPEGPPVRFYGIIDRINRHPDGSVEIIDYKTGRPKSQKDVDADQQLSAYALALAMGAVRHPETGERLPPASKLTLYFTETDRAVSTTRSPEQLDEFRTHVLETARRMRRGDFTAAPEQWRCDRCDYRLICPSRWGSDPVA
jgi:DNA helicase II / ATP-dependent DNA helicase PcrA